MGVQTMLVGNPPDDGTPVALGVVVSLELCEQGCGERVRYWNDESGGNAACGCTVEGPEACAAITIGQVREFVESDDGPNMHIARTKETP